MLYYLVAVVVGIFLANPIEQWLSSTTGHNKSSPHKKPLSPRPRFNESLLAMQDPNDIGLDCPADTYGARVLSIEPLVIYLENFLSTSEREHLLELSEPLFEPSTVTHDSSTTQHNPTVRLSEVALVPRTAAVRCIERRALALQGFRRDVFIERLRTQRYRPGGHYAHHYDWSANVRGWGRVSSMMVWVDAEAPPLLEGGGTEFPRLHVRGREDGRGLCDIIECPGSGGQEEEEEEEGQAERGTTFKPRAGSAVYWENFGASGKGYEETWHAGLPVTKGIKVGLNIWSFGRIE